MSCQHSAGKAEEEYCYPCGTKELRRSPTVSIESQCLSHYDSSGTMITYQMAKTCGSSGAVVQEEDAGVAIPPLGRNIYE
jgi:hypothetical protein